MTRRLKLAGLGLCALVFPACSASNNGYSPYYTRPDKSGIVLLDKNPNALYPPSQQQPGYTPYSKGTYVADSRFGPIEPSVAQNMTPTPPAPPVEVVNEPNKITITQQPARIATPTPSRLAATTPSPQVLILPDASASARKQPPPLDAVQPPVVVPPITPVSATRGTFVPNEPVIAPPWPNPGAPIGESSKAPTDLLPKVEQPVLPLPVPSQTSQLIVPPQQTAAVSMKVAEQPTPTLTPMDGAVGVLPPPSANETHLVSAIKAFQSNRPEEAAEHLKLIDSSNQELMMYLVQITARLGEGNVNNMTPEELAMLIDRLQAVSGMLRSKASLRTDRVCFCRNVHKFADVEAYEPHHEFHPRETVFLYAEIKNFTNELVNVAQRQVSAVGMQHMYAIRLAATLELFDSRNKVIWRTDLPKNDFAQKPQQDYYQVYRFSVPDRLPPGIYTLWLSVIDKPTGRVVRKPIEMRIGQG